MPRLDPCTDEQARGFLEDYVFPKECVTDDFPSGLKQELVSEYLGERITADLTHFSFARAARVLRFYALRDRIDQLIGFLGGGERTSQELDKTCSMIVPIAELGTPAQQKRAVEEFHRLLADRVAEEDFGVLIHTYFSLPSRTPLQPLKDRVHAAAVHCERKGPANKLGELIEYDARLVPWVISAKSVKDGIMREPIGRERFVRLVRAYLVFDFKTPFLWDEQAGFALLADARTAGDEAVAEAFKEVMTRADDDDEEGSKFRKTRAYCARAYFLDQLDEEEEVDRVDNMRMQEDLIM